MTNKQKIANLIIDIYQIEACIKYGCHLANHHLTYLISAKKEVEELKNAELVKCKQTCLKWAIQKGSA